MSGAREVAGEAVFKVEPLLTEMYEMKYIDNECALGTIVLPCGTEAQVQLKITKDPMQFLLED